jgi:hypothetical protein
MSQRFDIAAAVALLPCPLTQFASTQACSYNPVHSAG